MKCKGNCFKKTGRSLSGGLITWSVFTCIFMLTNCSVKHNEICAEKTNTVISKSETYKFPGLPDTIKASEQHTKYLVEHYWDNFSFDDTSLIHKPEILEQAFVDFVFVLKYVPPYLVKSGVTILMQRAAVNWDMQHFIIDLFEKYLYDPNSPIRDEELYIPVLEYIVHSPVIKNEDKITPEYRLKMALKNRVGQKATDFVFKDRLGKKHRLSEVKNDYILLYFNNPGCHACQQTTEMMSGSSLFHDARLSIVAIYADDDMNEWLKHANEMPYEWINGYSPEGELMKKELYDLKAIPTLYLIDSNGIVLFKDAEFKQIQNYLVNVFN